MYLLQKVAYALRHAFARNKGIQILLPLLTPLALSGLFGAGFYWAERDAQKGLTVLDSIWWAMVTMTTVGYGDFYPQTTLGRFLIGFPAFLIGIGVLGYLIGLIADRIFSHTAKRRKGLSIMSLTDHIIICDCPAEGKVIQIARELRAVPAYQECDIVLVCPKLEEQSEALREERIDFIKGEPTSAATLERAGIRDARGLIILSCREDEHDADARVFAISAIASDMARKDQTPPRIISELKSRQNAGLMRMTNNAGIMSHEGVTDCLLVQEFLNPGINEIFHQIITNARGWQLFIRGNPLTDVLFVDAQIEALRCDKDMQLIGLIRDGVCTFKPERDYRIQPEDKLVLLAESPDHFALVEQALAPASNPS